MIVSQSLKTGQGSKVSTWEIWHFIYWKLQKWSKTKKTFLYDNFDDFEYEKLNLLKV